MFLVVRLEFQQTRLIEHVELINSALDLQTNIVFSTKYATKLQEMSPHFQNFPGRRGHFLGWPEGYLVKRNQSQKILATSLGLGNNAHWALGIMHTGLSADLLLFFSVTCFDCFFKPFSTNRREAKPDFGDFRSTEKLTDKFGTNGKGRPLGSFLTDMQRSKRRRYHGNDRLNVNIRNKRAAIHQNDSEMASRLNLSFFPPYRETSLKLQLMDKYPICHHISQPRFGMFRSKVTGVKLNLGPISAYRRVIFRSLVKIKVCTRCQISVSDDSYCAIKTPFQSGPNVCSMAKLN